VSATAAPALRLIPGPDGADSPPLDGGVPASVWDVWLHVAGDRAAGRRTPLPVLSAATGADLEASSWPRWWERRQRGGVLLHRAAVVHTPGGGRTLVSRCGYSAPARPTGAVDETATEVIHIDWNDDRRTYCAYCIAAPTPT